MNVLTLDHHQPTSPLPGLLGNPTARAFFGGMTMAAVGTSFSTAEAGGTATGVDLATPLKNVTGPICQVYRALTGVLGIGFLLCLLVFAGLKYASGNSKATSQAVAAVIGAIIVFSARTILNLADSTGGAAGSFKAACGTGYSDPTATPAAPTN